jgi:hypothetical protein
LLQQSEEQAMDQDDKERLKRQIEDRFNKRFGDGVVRTVEVLQHGDEPEIEPGQTTVRVILNPTDDDPEETLHAFERAHRETIKELRARITESMPFIGRLQFTVPTDSRQDKHPVLSMQMGQPDRSAASRDLTPVMARLDTKDVETLDALITAGIVSNRAEGVRWTLARIRERPAYAQLREHIDKIDELKAQF